MYQFLAEHRQRLFPAEMFADLFGSGRGRPSTPGSVVATVMVLQALECLSDREAVQRLRRDIAWKAAAGLSLTDSGFHPTVLTLWRARLRASERPERIFDAVREVITESGVLENRGRRALDSTILHDAVATGDTVTMIASQIRRCRRLIPEASDLVLVAHDYESKTKPSCDWSDPDSRSELIDGLVTDGLTLIEAVEGVKLNPEQSDALGLLGVVAGQDVEPDPHREGRWRIARRVAKDRTISTVDPEARHGHKTRTRKRDGIQGPCRRRTRNRTGHRGGAHPCQHPRHRCRRQTRCPRTPRHPHHRRLGLRFGLRARNPPRSRPHPGRQTHRTQTPHQRRLPPRRLRYRHQRTDSDLSRRAHQPHTSRRYRPLREAMQRLPPASTMHHLGEGTNHHSRPVPRPPRREQGPLGQRRNPKTPTGTTGRPSSGPSPGSPATTPDASHTEESSPTNNLPPTHTRQQHIPGATSSTPSGRLLSTLLGHRGRKDDPLYRMRRLLTAAHEKISDRGQTRLRGLLDAGDPHGEVRTAWHAKGNGTGHLRDRHSGPCSPIHPPARRRPRRRILPTRDQQVGSHHQPLERPDHQLAHLESNQRTHRSSQQPHQTHQTSSVRVTQLRELPNPGPPLRGETQLGPPRVGHSPLKSTHT